MRYQSSGRFVSFSGLSGGGKSDFFYDSCEMLCPDNLLAIFTDYRRAHITWHTYLPLISSFTKQLQEKLKNHDGLRKFGLKFESMILT